jgi:type III secretion protein L
MASPADKQKAMLQSLTDPGDQVALKSILRGSATQNLEVLPMDSFAFPEFKVQGRASIVKPKDEKTLQIESMQRTIDDLERSLSKARAETIKQSEVALAKGTSAGITQGIQEGEQKATLIFQEQIAKLQSDLGKTLQAMNIAYGNRISEVEKQAIELSIGISKRLFSIEAEIHPQKIASVISEGFAHLGQAETVVLHVNPLDIAFAENTQSIWQPLHSSLKSVRIEEDARVERGGCWIESEGGGTVDLRAQVQWDRVEQTVREIMRRLDDTTANATAEFP